MLVSGEVLKVLVGIGGGNNSMVTRVGVQWEEGKWGHLESGCGQAGEACTAFLDCIDQIFSRGKSLLYSSISEQWQHIQLNL